jgi:hypothetical protein
VQNVSQNPVNLDFVKRAFIKITENLFPKIGMEWVLLAEHFLSAKNNRLFSRFQFVDLLRKKINNE